MPEPDNRNEAFDSLPWLMTLISYSEATQVVWSCTSHSSIDFQNCGLFEKLVSDSELECALFVRKFPWTQSGSITQTSRQWISVVVRTLWYSFYFETTQQWCFVTQ